MTAPPKLETIKYKEIPTPKWRVEDIKPLSDSNGTDIEVDFLLVFHLGKTEGLFYY